MIKMINKTRLIYKSINSNRKTKIMSSTSRITLNDSRRKKKKHNDNKMDQIAMPTVTNTMTRMIIWMVVTMMKHPMIYKKRPNNRRKKKR